MKKPQTIYTTKIVKHLTQVVSYILLGLRRSITAVNPYPEIHYRVAGTEMKSLRMENAPFNKLTYTILI